MSASRIRLVTSGHRSEGRGHVARTLTLAETLAASGAVVVVDVLRGSLTSAQARSVADLGIATGPGSDASQAPDAVVVDLPDPNEPADRWPADRLVVFDDSDAFTGAAAVVVQPSMPRWTGAGRADRVLIGPAFAPIRASLRRRAEDPPPLADPPEIVVCFGGSDPADVSARLVPAVAEAVSSAADPRHPSVSAIVGPGYGGTLGPDTRWTVVRDPDDLDDRLSRSILAVIGGGTMKYELALLGVPALIVAVSDDQLPVAPAFAELGAARYLGDGRVIDPGEVGAAVSTLLADAPTRDAMARAGRAAVDGRGADRIAEAVLAIATGR